MALPNPAGDIVCDPISFIHLFLISINISIQRWKFSAQKLVNIISTVIYIDSTDFKVCIGWGCIMICNICGSGVSFMSNKRSWICSGCGAVDPPIQVRPIKKDSDLGNIEHHSRDYPDFFVKGDPQVNILRKRKSFEDSYANRD